MVGVAVDAGVVAGVAAGVVAGVASGVVAAGGSPAPGKHACC